MLTNSQVLESKEIKQFKPYSLDLSIKPNPANISLKVRKFVSNWVIFSALPLGNNSDPFIRDVIFRDGNIIKTMTKDDLFFLLNCIYFSSQFLSEDKVTKTVRRLYELSTSIKLHLSKEWEGQRKGLGGWPGTKEILLYLLIRKYYPEVVVETGVAQGVSSMFILQAMDDNDHGSLVSIDLPNFNQDGHM